MKILFLLILITCFRVGLAQTDDLAGTANAFLTLLNDEVKTRAQYKLDDEERFNWHFVPRYRNGVSLHDLTQPQLDLAMNLLKASMSVQGYKKATDIMALENVLREIENRGTDDSYRDPMKYFFSIFGTPSKDKPWGWRLEGHHVSLNFSTINNKIESATPSFFGSNPATVPSGKRKGEQVLKDESALGFSLVNSFSSAQLKIAMVSETAFPDILSYNKRKALQLDPKGMLYADMNEQQKKTFYGVTGCVCEKL